MSKRGEAVVILMADDDADDRTMTKEALEESRLTNEFRVVENGEELLDYLRRRGKFSNPETSPRPGVILLDLNMPRMDGREAHQRNQSRSRVAAHSCRDSDDLEGRRRHLSHV